MVLAAYKNRAHVPLSVANVGTVPGSTSGHHLLVTDYTFYFLKEIGSMQQGIRNSCVNMSNCVDANA